MKKEYKTSEQARKWTNDWYHRNKESRKANSKKQREKLKANNPAKYQLLNARNANRNLANKKNLIHPELDQDKELDFFKESQRLTALTGMLHHVDHIIPLSAGGWHHHLNFQVMPANLNQSKTYDPFWEMEGYLSWRDVPEYLWPDKMKGIYKLILLSQSTDKSPLRG